MFILPCKLNAGEYSLFVVLQDDNIARIQEHDPAEVTMGKMGGEWQKLRLRDVIITYATPEEETQVISWLKAGEPVEKALKLLTRGFVFRPDKGDHDKPYTSAVKE